MRPCLFLVRVELMEIQEDCECLNTSKPASHRLEGLGLRSETYF